VRRREFVLCALSAGLAAPVAQSQTRAQVGWLSYGDHSDPSLSVFIGALRGLGWREEANLNLIVRIAQELPDLQAAASDLLGRDLRVLVTVGGRAARLAKEGRPRFPVVFSSLSDIPGSGLVTDPNRPSGNMTGVALREETIPKLLELAKELRPEVRLVGHIFEPAARAAPVRPELAQAYAEAANRLGVGIRDLPVGRLDDLRPIFETAANKGIDAVIVDSAGLVQFHRYSIATYAREKHLPAIGRERMFASAGGLASFGEEPFALYRRTAAHVDKLLKGADAADIPVEEASRYELVLNQATATALHLTLPLLMLARADDVIE
jgi:putative tryptophan/tyrosine transport system substrate-binding protein